MAPNNLPVVQSGGPLQASVLQPVIPLAFSNPGMSIAQVLAILKASKKIGMVAGFVIFVLMAIVGVSKPKSYSATATLQVDYQINDPLGGKEFPVNLIGTYIATQMELLSGPVVLGAVVDKLQLYDQKRFAGKMTASEQERRAAAEAVLEKNVTVSGGKLASQLIFITYTANSSMDAADVANAIADVYTSRSYRHSAVVQDAEEKQRSEAQIKALKDKVTESQTKLFDFLERTGLIASEAGDVEMSALGTIEAQLQDARNRRRVAEVTYSANRDVNQTLGSVTVQTLRTKLRDQEAQMAQFRLTDGPKNPRVVELQGQIDATKQSIAEQTRLDTGDSGSQLAQIRGLEARLQKAADDQRERVRLEAANKEEREKLKLELDNARAAYRRAEENMEQIEHENNSKYSGINLISRATPPLQGTGKKKSVALIMALVAGIIAGIGASFVWGMLNRKVRCRDDIERDYGIPVIAEFPMITT